MYTLNGNNYFIILQHGVVSIWKLPENKDGTSQNHYTKYDPTQYKRMIGSPNKSKSGKRREKLVDIKPEEEEGNFNKIIEIRAKNIKKQDKSWIRKNGEYNHVTIQNVSPEIANAFLKDYNRKETRALTYNGEDMIYQDNKRNF